ncbi:ABC transporter permease [Cellulomonas fimi]|uniref:Transport permease protein n=1 Tax=Cellulomonas fimi (strain ATCC 484 / DSM 20113 / JCM 1341 / CCUG 24087 / LMG 16345 / NBRC 15513 / NCIMB 8980 / NCTC 7547 / NRS-133) TaxID=590998 RepID=F4H0F3_CELFA|nr:ABC transporter permease [Cellulomonas fimi]AEE47322.1 ABC-2 type transporter [Cellulomonas fimi ATCC 484]NNH05849.1 ABC transporter permease [Cellulomonas fimi]VEH35918.1 Daunorubicin/doxorubicin resistance ABC transporter permease protein drrB [Cellulomonas fimi]
MTATTTTVARRPTRVPPGGPGWALRDAWTVTLRDLGHWRRQPWDLLIGLAFPLLLLLMFGYLLGGAIDVPGGYVEFLFPGMLAVTMAFGLETTMTAVAQDVQRGVTDRFRSLPMSRAAVLLGRAVADMLSSVVGLLALLVGGLLVGWRWHHGLGPALAALGLLLLLRFAFLWLGIWLGLLFRGQGGVTAVQILVWPFAFLSNAFVPISTMPGWLEALSAFNPITATVAATRELFGNPTVAGTGWAAENALLLAVVWPVVLTAVFGALAVRRYARLGR